MKPIISTRTLSKAIGLLVPLLLPVIMFAQPANDACTAPTNLTSSTTACLTPTNGGLRSATTAATATAGIQAFCGNAASPDVWYTFTAQSAFPVITLNSMGTSMDNAPRLQIFNNVACTPAATLNGGELGCVSGTNVTTLSLDVATAVGGLGLTIGNVYRVRVFTNGNTALGSQAQWAFTICVQDDIPPAPSNDDCSGAIHLPYGGGCGSVAGTMASATPSGIAVTPCGGGAATWDVWYKFTATTNNPTITLGGAANSFTNRRMMLFTGNCGTLVPFGATGCGTNSMTPTAVPGTTYYIRVYSTTGGPAPALNANFTICVSTTNLPPRFGNSYVNFSKRRTGGVVQTGDTLEVRMTINHTSGTIFRPRYVDSIPTNTQMLSLTTDSIRVITNEGLTFFRYTPTPNTNNDAATYLTNPPAGQYHIKMNLGSIANPPGTPTNNTPGDITGAVGQFAAGSDQPRGGGGVLFATSYRVRVTGVAGDTIKFATGKFIYRTSLGGADITLNSIPYQIVISNPMTLCSNSVGLSSAEEFGGTFGSGTSVVRDDDLSYPIPGYTFVGANGVNDGQYSIVKNMSPRNSTFATPNKQPTCGTPTNPDLNCNNRMHNGFWDVTGDHTGTNDAFGNPPAGPGDNAGYMLMVNADYVASEVYRQSLTGLCPGTYYEFSAWIKNICTPCGRDAGDNPTYRPGVYPNLTFILDGVDRYSTGEVDTLGWTKKGFVFITGPTQTSISFAIRNNSQGGGGNDWAIDDITVATCLPSMGYSPSALPNVCRLNAVTIYDTVRSFFNNYVYYKWQRSTTAGASWTDITAAQGPASPVFNNTTQSWEYLTHFVVPPIWTDVANDGDLYRVVAATTIPNLSSVNCIFTSGIPFLTMNVQNCGTPLKVDLLSFNGKLVADKANLTWTTSKEDEPVKYQIERSTDGNIYTVAGTIEAYNNGSAENVYNFVDPVAVSGKVYYRVVIISNDANKKYSRTISLSRDGSKLFAIGTVVNPFNTSLSFDINSPADMKVEAELLDLLGKVVKRKTFVIHAGVNQLSLTDTDALPSGTYIFRVKNNDQILTKKVIKGNLL